MEKGDETFWHVWICKLSSTKFELETNPTPSTVSR